VGFSLSALRKDEGDLMHFRETWGFDTFRAIVCLRRDGWDFMHSKSFVCLRKDGRGCDA
jgi:hypothetical protein